jgi:hypothetical protein
MVKKYLTIGQKLDILNDCNQRQLNGESLKSVARSHGVQPSQIRTWKKKVDQLAASRKRKKKSLNKGKEGRLAQFEDDIIGWALDRREAGFALRYDNIRIRAIEVYPEFGNLPPSQQYHSVRRLCIRNCLRIRKITHQSQRIPQDLIDEAQAWLVHMRPILAAPDLHQRFIINMDQTPMYLSMHPKQTLELQGSRTVHGRITTEGDSRFTCTIAISANGDKLKPMCIFKGTVRGRIVQREFPQNPTRDDIVLCCQTAAWQDKDNMLLWIDRVLVPYLQDRAQGAPAAILLDQFKVHWTNEVLARLNQLGITPYKIPAGCTGLVQPVDVGIGKPFKDHIRSQWSAWRDDEGADASLKLVASRSQGCQWVKNAWYEKVTTETVKNSWRKSGFSYFVE